jgi:hypothetical protein
MAGVADQLYLSYKLRGFSNMNMLRHWERLLRKFPYSRLSKTGSTVYIRAVSYAEPALFEQGLPDPLDLDTVLQLAKEFTAADCAAELETKWDLWRFDGDWKLSPSRVTLTCFAAGFEDSDGDHLRVDFGSDSIFLPDPELPNALFMSQSNIKSLLHFVHEADTALTVENRRLWTESGENFAERLQATLEAG